MPWSTLSSLGGPFRVQRVPLAVLRLSSFRFAVFVALVFTFGVVFGFPKMFLELSADRVHRPSIGLHIRTHILHFRMFCLCVCVGVLRLAFGY